MFWFSKKKDLIALIQDRDELNRKIEQAITEECRLILKKLLDAGNDARAISKASGINLSYLQAIIGGNRKATEHVYMVLRNVAEDDYDVAWNS